MCNTYTSVFNVYTPSLLYNMTVMKFVCLVLQGKETRSHQKKKWLFKGWKHPHIILFFLPNDLLEDSKKILISLHFFLDWLATSYLGNAGSDLEESQKTKKSRNGDLMQCGTGLSCLMTFRVGKRCFLQQNNQWEVHVLHTWAHLWHYIEGAWQSLLFLQWTHLYQSFLL